MDGPHTSAPPPRVIVKEVHRVRIRISSFWIIGPLALVVGGYWLATDWAEKGHKELNSFDDYVKAATSALEDKKYVTEELGKVQDALQAPACDVPLKWQTTTGPALPCYLTLDAPVRFYPGPDPGIFITVPADSVVKIAEPAPDNTRYAYAQTFKLSGAAVPTGATAADACIDDHRCTGSVDDLNAAGRKPAPQASPPVAAASSPFDGTYGCTKNASDNPEDYILRLDQKNKSVRQTIKYTPPMSCEFLFKDGVFGPLVSRDTCNLPFPTTNVFQRVEFTDDTVFFSFFEKSSTGPLTPEQRAASDRLNVKTGVKEASNGDHYQCRPLSPK